MKWGQVQDEMMDSCLGTGFKKEMMVRRGQVQDEMMTIHGDRFRRDRRAYMGTGLEEVSRNKSSEKIRT